MAKKQEKSLRQRRKSKNPIKKKKRFSRSKIISIVTIIIVLFSTIVSYAFVTQIVIPTQLARSTPLSILVIGTDHSSSRDEWWAEGDKASLTDSLMVLTFNPTYYRFEVTSIPRDTSVDYICDDIYELNNIDEKYQDQINEVYYMSGYDVSCVQDTIANFLQIDINYYAMLDFDEFQNIIDEIGGVTVTAHAADGVLTQMNETSTETYSWNDGQVYENMPGDEALTYARARHDSEKDYGRGIRQQQVVSAVMQKALSGENMSLSLLTSLMGMLTTDIPVKLAYEYYKFLNVTEDVGQMLIDDKKFTELMLPETGWKYMFDWFEYEDPSGGKITVDDVNSFNDWLLANNKSGEITSYFFSQHQFFNEAYSSHYNVVPEQLNEISNALRVNLGMEPLDNVPVPSFPYGDNEGNGYIPTKWAKGSGGSSSESEPAPSAPQGESEDTDEYYDDYSSESTDESSQDSNTNQNTTPTEPKDEQPADTQLDTDKDGIPDKDDAYPTDPKNGEGDEDGDGIIDKDDAYPTDPNNGDRDHDGILDVDDAYPDDANNGASSGDDDSDDESTINV